MEPWEKENENGIKKRRRNNLKSIRAVYQEDMTGNHGKLSPHKQILRKKEVEVSSMFPVEILKNIRGQEKISVHLHAFIYI